MAYFEEDFFEEGVKANLISILDEIEREDQIMRVIALTVDPVMEKAMKGILREIQKEMKDIKWQATLYIS